MTLEIYKKFLNDHFFSKIPLSDSSFSTPENPRQSLVAPSLSNALQLLLASLLKLRRSPELTSLPPLERLTLSVGAWPQLWVLQLLQSGLSVRGLVPEHCPGPVAKLDGFERTMLELRALCVDEAEVALLEKLTIANTGIQQGMIN